MSKKLSQSEIDELVKSLLAGEIPTESPAAPAAPPAAAPAAPSSAAAAPAQAAAPVSTPASGPSAAPAPAADEIPFDRIVDLGPITQAEVDAVARGETAVADGARTAARGPAPQTPRTSAMNKLYGALMEIEVPVSVELGRTRLPLGDVLALGPGSVITLETVANSPVDVLVNRVPLMKGEVLAIGEKYGVRIIESRIGKKAAS